MTSIFGVVSVPVDHFPSLSGSVEVRLMSRQRHLQLHSIQDLRKKTDLVSLEKWDLCQLLYSKKTNCGRRSVARLSLDSKPAAALSAGQQLSSDCLRLQLCRAFFTPVGPSRTTNRSQDSSIPFSLRNHNCDLVGWWFLEDFHAAQAVLFRSNQGYLRTLFVFF